MSNSDRKTVYKLKTKNGSWMNMMISSIILEFDYDGKARYLLGYGVKIIEDKLHKSLNQFIDIEQKSENLLKFNKLSKREIEILAFIANCFTDKKITDKLKLSINTTKTHRKRIINKFGLKNTASLVKLALENNLV
jgi:DNA-binding NarL/FixJ family response regulator